MTESILSQQALSEIDHWLAKYPADQKQSAVLAALRIAQEHNEGYLTEALMDAVAAYLDMPNIAVYEVASFYHMYEHKPVGRHVIHVCTSISCHLTGAKEMIAHLEKRLGIKLGETTADKKFTLKAAGCLGACIGAPMLQINKTYYEQLTPARIDEILEELE